MSDETFARDFWERRWEQALREHPDAVANRSPNSHLVGAVAELNPGVALDAGCGHGAEAIWLAASGWQVTAVDFSATALERARAPLRSPPVPTSPAASIGSRAISGAGSPRPDTSTW